MEEFETKKIIKKWGNSYIIVLGQEEKKFLNIKEGDIVNIKYFKENEN